METHDGARRRKSSKKLSTMIPINPQHRSGHRSIQERNQQIELDEGDFSMIVFCGVSNMGGLFSMRL
jgi:hypothetical protein